MIRPFRHDRVVAITIACVACACTGSADREDTSTDSTGIVESEPSVERREVGSARVEMEEGEATLGYEIIDGLPITEGDVVLPPDVLTTDAAVTIGRRWPNALVPYVIEADLPEPERATSAMAHWKERTNVRFVARTTQSDYVSFHPSTGCSSMIGKTGGRQTINLTTGEGAWNVVGVGIDRGSDTAYYFYKRGFATAGSTSRADAKRSHFKYTLPSGKTPANIVEIGFSSSGHVLAWYTDGTVSEGTTTELAKYAAPAPYALAPGKSPADVLAIAIDRSDVTHAFYKDGSRSTGTARSITTSAGTFTVAPGKSITSLAHVDVSSSGTFVAFYSDGTTSTGAAATLGTGAAGRVSYPGHCSTGSTIHEIGHAVGLYHEQTRADRDAWVVINWSNISSSASHNFQKYSSGSDHGAYDFGSIMHYDSYSFSANGQPTIVKKSDGSTFVGQRTALSTGDIAAARSMYPGPPVSL